MPRALADGRRFAVHIVLLQLLLRSACASRAFPATVFTCLSSFVHGEWRDAGYGAISTDKTERSAALSRATGAAAFLVNANRIVVVMLTRASQEPLRLAAWRCTSLSARSFAGAVTATVAPAD